ncbi:MAG: hypothetical protein HC913_14235 [Microscillaceae bacterium]|nr:hypothetical protein [Microscillaceae bacterium]
MKQTLFFAASLIFCFFGACASLQAQFTPPRILKHPTQIRTERLNLLNSLHRETNLNVTPDGQYLFFMSGRGQMPWSTPNYTTYKGQPEFDGDIWYAQKAGTTWQAPRCLGNTINTSQGEDEPNISPDGQRVYFQSWRHDWETTNGPYYQATLSGINWGYPAGLGGGITQFFRDMSMLPPIGSLGTDGATLSPDGRTFIVAAGKDYQGNLDLYISRKNAYGQWSYLTRLSVSTLGNERSPFWPVMAKPCILPRMAMAVGADWMSLKPCSMKTVHTGRLSTLGHPLIPGSMITASS